MRRIITLTTDFGDGSSYAAQMKGVILSMNPDVQLVDVTHAVPPQNVRQGAMILSEMHATFPLDTIHVAVVDPGVGTDRKIIYARVAGQHFVAPDNGLLSLVTKKNEVERDWSVFMPTWTDFVIRLFIYRVETGFRSSGWVCTLGGP